MHGARVPKWRGGRSAWLRAGLFAGLLGVGASPAAQTDAWVERARQNDTGTVVWVRERGAAPPEFRAVTRIQARLSALAAVLLDPGNMPQWVYRTRHARSVAMSSPTSGVAFVVSGMPGPLDDRESLVAWRLWQDGSGRITMQGEAAPAELGPAPDPRRVRMTNFASRWQFQPLGNGVVEVTFEGHADFGGNLNLPLVRDFVRQAIWLAPLHTVDGLRRMAAMPRYRDAQLAFIREPAA